MRVLGIFPLHRTGNSPLALYIDPASFLVKQHEHKSLAVSAVTVDMKHFPAGDLEGLQQVGKGGFGTVYKGWSRSLNMEVALKTFQGAQSFSINKLMKNILKEREVMEKASNPFVILLLGMYERQEGQAIEHGLVMEYMPNGSLRSLFDITDVPWALRFQMLHQVALGMNYLHTLHPPIIHRDLKPSNVLLNKHFDAKITDFGLSKIVGATTSAVPSFAGTPSYMAPEALVDLNYKPTMAFDVYSFGILIWTVLSGEEPFPNAFLELIQFGVPKGQRPSLEVLDPLNHIKMVPEAKELMIKCWSGNPDARPRFLECSHSTRLTFEKYSNEIQDAIRTMQDLKHHSQDQILEDPGYDSTSQDANQVIAAINEDSEDMKKAEKSEDADNESSSKKRIVKKAAIKKDSEDMKKAERSEDADNESSSKKRTVKKAAIKKDSEDMKKAEKSEDADNESSSKKRTVKKAAIKKDSEDMKKAEKSEDADNESSSKKRTVKKAAIKKDSEDMKKAERSEDADNESSSKKRIVKKAIKKDSEDMKKAERSEDADNESSSKKRIVKKAAIKKDSEDMKKAERSEDAGYDSFSKKRTVKRVVAAIDKEEKKKNVQPQAVAAFNKTTNPIKDKNKPSDKGGAISNAIEAIKESRDYDRIKHCAEDIGKTVEKGGQEIGKVYKDYSGEISRNKISGLWESIKKLF
ncbi:receptor-interacting serine/threonine-protein kinase 4 isoform X4 [Xenopus laevis]|uniref:Receptor-interacting serine/threonine-protein kinase 4 isoform X4 n=1 Tax=Xenopus laevis TaxID=8355 RepID=A0A8J1LL04_XENLA|nr:receptor-interacting serine/threonine-protein kinase 4 isoform X4 [Xenopus laevis]